MLNEASLSVTEGTLYRLDPDGVIHKMDIGIKGLNGIG